MSAIRFCVDGLFIMVFFSRASKYMCTNHTAYTNIHLQFQLQQIANHLAGGNPRGRPQGREVQRAGEGIGIAEEQHGRDPAARILQRKARRLHLVLLDLAATEVVHAAGGVDLGLELAGHVRQLRAVQDVEVVVCGMAAGVALGADGGAWVC